MMAGLRDFVTLTVAVVMLGAFSETAHACGLTPPIGPNGLPSVCHGDEGAWRFRAGLTGGGTSTRIDFGATEARLLQGATAATFDVFPTERLAIGLSVGAALGGHIDFEGRRYALSPGAIAGVGVSYRLWGGKLPFVHASGTLSIARSTTRAEDTSDTSFTSKDWRVGLAVGKALGSVAAPFAVFRYFGAGTEWAVAGGHGADAFRYQVGVGSAFGITEHWDALAELAFLGEKRATLGVGYTF